MSELVDQSRRSEVANTQPEAESHGANAPIKKSFESPSEKTDQFKKASEDWSRHSQNKVNVSQTFGRKIATSSFKPNFSAGAHTLAHPHHYQKILKESVFKNFKTNGPLHRYLTTRANPEQATRKNRPLSAIYLAQLVRLRHQVSDRVAYRHVLRHEIHKRRETEIEQKKEGFLKKGFQTEKAAYPAAKGESGFEKKLKEAQIGKEGVAFLKEGKQAQYATKSETGWKQFFINVLARGSEEASTKKSTGDFSQALFRGLFKTSPSEQNMTLVTDLKYGDIERLVSEKFARIAIENPDVLRQLQKMEPGDPVPPDLLNALGPEIEYLRLYHTGEGLPEQGRDQMLQQLKNQANPALFARLEKMIFPERIPLEFKEGFRRPENTHREDHPSQGSVLYPYAFGETSPPEKKRFLGPPRLAPFVFYSTVAILLALFIYFVVSRIF